MSGRPSQDGIWQSFADLAMGLVGVLLLIVVVLVSHEQEQRRAQEADALALQEFAQELLLVIEEAQGVESRQEEAVAWLTRVFEETRCPLQLNARTGALEPAGDEGSSLYDTGATRVSSAASAALEQCREAFHQLAACISPETSPLRAQCAHPPEADLAQEIDALVLSGSTDRLPYRDAPRIQGPGTWDLHSLTEAFADNSYLGSERARQALGHLLWRAQDAEGVVDEDDYSAIQVLMAKVRVESSSFAQYQVGPPEWRDEAGRDCGEDACEPARSLSLRLRWKEQSLRRPFSNVVARFCREWSSGTLRDVIGRSGAAHAARAARVCAQHDARVAE